MRRFRIAMPVILLFVVAAAAGSWAVADELRLPHVADQFYPGEPSELRDLVVELLQDQPEPAITKKPRVLISPHAGYQYSGLIAAAGYRHLQGHAYDGVVVVAFTHRMQFSGSSVDTVEAYQTPLGQIPVDREAAAVLQTYPGISHVSAAHESAEHSLETQLPFLQVALERFRLVPVLMSGSAGYDEAKQLAAGLAALTKLGDYLFVFSTDLSHYHPYGEAETMDEGTISALLFETPEAVQRLFLKGEVEACGRGPILASLLLNRLLGYPDRRLLTRANSGDTMGNPDSVVGYASLGMFDAPRDRGRRLSDGAGQALVAAARQTLESRLGGKSPRAPAALGRYPELSRASGLFVTLRKQGSLRGCIGRIQTDEPLSRSLPAVAVDAALRDSRFPPVTAQELPELHVEVSVLTAPAPIKALEELVPGRDGVILTFEGRQGVFLPQVWIETGWTRLEFLRELASQKAGLPPDAWQHADLRVFQDQIFEEPHGQFLGGGATEH